METLNSEYSLLAKQITTLTVGENYPITNMSQFAALVFNSIENVNWAGFYLLAEHEHEYGQAQGHLQLGPFQGQVACTKIPMGQGVCGSAAEKKQTLLVDDVDQFAGHIACDSRSRSEIVVPLIVEQQLIGVFDLDSPIVNRFNQDDQRGIEEMIRLLIETTDFSLIHF